MGTLLYSSRDSLVTDGKEYDASILMCRWPSQLGSVQDMLSYDDRWVHVESVSELIGFTFSASVATGIRIFMFWASHFSRKLLEPYGI